MASKGTQGLVSVIVASYNHAEFLEQRIESLIGQTYNPIEIVVIDDCSTDNSVEILRRYASQPKVKLVLREKNGGWVAVSNQGVELSTGEYVMFGNCDDACDASMVERLVASLERNPNAGVAFCRSVMIDEKDRVIGDDFLVRERAFRQRCAADAVIRGDEMSRFLLHSCVIPNLSAALIRRQCIEAVGLFSEAYRACSDWDFFFRVASRFDFCYTAAALNRFRQHETTIRHVMKAKATYEEYFRLLLGQIRTLDLSVAEHCRFRAHVMYLWAVHLLSPAQHGLQNFPFHLKKVLSLDPASLVFLVPSLLWRVSRVLGKSIIETVRSPSRVPRHS